MYRILLLISCFVYSDLVSQCTSGRVTFRVDMRNEAVDPGGVYFASIFQGDVGQSAWTPEPMCDLGSGIWEMTFCGVPTGTQTFKFLNGPGGWEFDATAGGAGTPGSCNTGVGTNDREVNIVGGNQLIGPYCFNTCDILCFNPDPGGTDNIAPTILNIPADITLNCGDALPVSDCLMAMDNCFVNCSTDLPVDDMSGLNPCGLGDITRTWTVIDEYGNSDMASQTITLQDNVVPIIDGSSIVDITVQCENVPPPNTLPASDVCDTGLTASEVSVDDFTGVDACGNGVIIRSWIASDCSGNNAIPVAQLIFVQDNTAPVIDGTGIMDIQVNCDAIPTPPTLSAVDNCDVSITQASYSEDLSAFDISCMTGIIIRTWTSADCSGNNAIPVVQMLTVVDLLEPTINPPADITIECGMPLPPLLSISASDNCDASISSTNVPTDDLSNLDACNLGVITRTWTVADCAGNIGMASQNISIEDNTQPDIIDIVPADITITCLDPLPAKIPLLASDVCDATLITTGVLFDDMSNLDANGIGIMIRTWTVTDCAGNSTSADQQITIEGTNPEFNFIDQYCIFDGQNYVLPIVSDNGIVGSWNIPSFIPSAFGLGNHTFEFEPDPGVCGGRFSLTISVVSGIVPQFDLQTLFCASDTNTYQFPNHSQNNISGTWMFPSLSPETEGGGLVTNIFTPDNGQCADGVILNIQIDTVIIPALPAIGPYCSELKDSIFLDSQSVNGVTGFWSLDTLVPFVIGPDTFDLIYTPLEDQCASVDTLKVLISDAVNAEFATLGPFCKEDNRIIELPDTSSNLIIGTWFPASFNPSLEGGSQFTSTFTPNSGQCAVMRTTQIELESPRTPTFDIIGPFCRQKDTLITLPLLSNEGISGSWIPSTFNPSLESGNNRVSTFTPSDGQCASTLVSTIGIVDYNLEILANAEICEGDNVTLDVSISTGLNYNWTGPSGFTSSETSPTLVNVLPNQTGEYCVETHFPECTLETCFTLTVLPTPTLVVDSTNCMDNTYSVSISTPEFTSIISDFGNVTVTSPSSFIISNIPLGQDISVGLQSGTTTICQETIPIIAPQCGCPNPALITSLLADQDNICIGDSIRLMAILMGSALTTTWTHDAASAQTQKLSETEYLFVPDQAGSFRITLTTNDPDGVGVDCQAASQSIDVSVKDKPNPPNIPNALVALCKDSLTQPLQATGIQLNWYDSAGNNLGSIAPTPDVSSVGQVTYFVSQNIDGCESELRAISVMVMDCGCSTPVSVSDILFSESEICQGSTIDVSIQVSDSSYEGQWSVRPNTSGIFLDATETTTSFTANQEGTFIIRYSTLDPDGMDPLCSEASDSLTINVYAVPDPPMTITTLNYCLGDTEQALVATGQNLLWYNENQIALGSTPPVPPTDQEGNLRYFVSQTTNECESELVEIVVSIQNCACVDQVNVVDLGIMNNELCVGEEVQLSAQVTGNFQTGMWLLNGEISTQFSSNVNLETTFTPNTVGVFTIAYLAFDVDDDGPCTRDSFEVEMQVDNLGVEVDIQDIDCENNGQITFTVMSSTGVYTISSSQLGSSLSDTLFDVLEGLYDFSVEEGGCMFSGQIDILDLRADENLDTKVFTIKKGDSQQLIPEIDEMSLDSFHWDNTQFLDDSNSFTPFASPENTITYTCIMFQGECRIIQAFEVRVDESKARLKDYLSNVFAPKGSGSNTSFGLKSETPYTKIISFKIWDRWGNLVHEVKDNDLALSLWDGRKGGTTVVSGVYVYYLSAIHEDGELEEAIGDISLIK